MSASDLSGDVPAIDTMEIIGGRLALMFVNTTNWVAEEAVDDRLVDGRALLRWARRAGVEAHEHPTAPSLGPIDVADLRRRLRGSLDADQPKADALQLVRSLISEVETAGDRVTAECRFVLHAVLFSAVDILSTDVVGQVRQCPGPRCGWMFIDTSPGKRRRWCSMTSCGNRAKSQRHYQLTKAEKAAR